MTFTNVIQNVIFTPESYGKLGGKSAGLFLATQILKKIVQGAEDSRRISKYPRPGISHRMLTCHFVNLNNFEEVIDQKYKEVSQVRTEYPNIVQTFKNATFPPEIVQGLSMALDDFGECPLIVRSSSLLEDRIGAAFSGKYKSLFLANQGAKENRLEASARCHRRSLRIGLWSRPDRISRRAGTCSISMKRWES